MQRGTGRRLSVSPLELLSQPRPDISGSMQRILNQKILALSLALQD